MCIIKIIGQRHLFVWILLVLSEKGTPLSSAHGKKTHTHYAALRHQVFSFSDSGSVSVSLSLSLSHFLAFLLCSPVVPAKQHVFFQFSRFSVKGGRKAKSRHGDSSLGPLFCDTGSPKTTFSGTSSNFRAVRGGGVLYPLLSI